MTDDLILYNVTDHVATITLNRPQKYNALNNALLHGLKTAFQNTAANESVRAVLLRANGNGFCAGQDIPELEAAKKNGTSVGEHLRTEYNKLIAQMRMLPKPIVCVINGVAAGAGASLTLAADVRIASEDASFVFGAFLKLGLIPDSGATLMLPQIVGMGRAVELMTLSDSHNRLGAETAHKWGLVNVVTKPDELLLEATAVAERLAELPTAVVGLTKRAVYTNPNHGLQEALEYEAQLQDMAARTDDHKEGVRAFLEKREPNFSGH